MNFNVYFRFRFYRTQQNKTEQSTTYTDTREWTTTTMNSIGEDCNKLKRDYDACFNTWFADKFLNGETNDSMCAPLFKVYQQCVKVRWHDICRLRINSDYNNKQFQLCFLYFCCGQEAIRDQKIELKEIEADHLGTEKEYKIPEKKDDKNKSKSTPKSW